VTSKSIVENWLKNSYKLYGQVTALYKISNIRGFFCTDFGHFHHAELKLILRTPLNLSIKLCSVEMVRMKNFAFSSSDLQTPTEDYTYTAISPFIAPS